MTKTVADVDTNPGTINYLMPLFQQLGDEIEAAWLARDYDEEIFATLAADALRNADIPSKMSAWDVLDWALHQTELPKQKDVPGNFGDPPITLYCGQRFYIDAYFWLHGTTATHQHAFCGAFQVFLGSSIHSWYNFEPHDRVNAFLQFGTMSLKTCELLQLGDVQEIQYGRKYIHSLFHLDQPSVTIVVRTGRSPLELPQFSYHKPSLAVDPFYENETTLKKQQIIGALYRSKHPEADRYVNETLDRSDLLTGFHILSSAYSWLSSDQLNQAFNASGAQSRFDAMLDAFERRHGERAASFREMFRRRVREADIINRRSIITNAEHRFYLALLLNIDSREAIFSVIRQRFPDADPIEKVLDWTFDLSETRLLGATNTNALGIADFDSLDMAVFEGLLKQQSTDEIRSELQKQDNVAPELIGQVAERIDKLQNAPIFRPLFEDTPDLVSPPAFH